MNVDLDKKNYGPFYTKDGIMSDIAVENDTLIEWMIITPKNFKRNSVINIRSIKEEISQINFDPFDQENLKKYYESIRELSVITSQDVGFIWLDTHPEFISIIDGIFGTLQYLDNETFLNVGNTKQRYFDWKGIIKRTKNKLLQKRNAIVEENNKLLSIPPTEFFDIVYDTTTFEQNFNYSLKELIYIFNAVELNPVFPFCYIQVKGVNGLQEWYKTYTHANVLEEWIQQTKDISLDKDDTEKMILVYRVDEDKFVYLYFEQNKITYNIKVDVQKNLQNLLSTDLRRLFENILTFEELNLYSLKMRFSVRDTPFNKNILLDMIFSNDLFSRFLISVESERTSSKSTKFGLLFMDSDPDLRINVSMNISDSTGELVVKITKGKSKEAIDYFLSVFSILLTIYKNEYQNIAEEYKKFIPTFNDKGEFKQNRQKVTGLTSDLLRSKYPEIFSDGWVKDCSGDRQPRFATEEEKDTLEDYEILQFPEPNEDGTGGGDFYTCVQHEQTGYKYIGLRENKLANKDNYPYLPCCFKNPNVGPKEKTGVTKNRLLTANKIIVNNREGLLVSNIETVFKKLKFPGTYRRLGFNIGIDSLIDCMEFSSTNKYGSANRVRQELKNTYNVCRQEMYDYSPESFENHCTYNELNYEMIYRGLEKLYECNLVCFVQKFVGAEKYKADMLYPRSYGVHFPSSVNRYQDTVFLLKQQMTPTQNQYTLIVDIQDNKKSRFRGPEIDTFHEFYSWMNQTYILNVDKKMSKYKNDFLPINFDTQKISETGKCVGLYNSSAQVLLKIDPQAPYDLPIGKVFNISDYPTAVKFLTTPVSEGGAGALVEGMNVYLNGGSSATIILSTGTSPRQNYSMVDKFNQQKRAAYHLQQYSLWYSSRLNRVLEKGDFEIVPNIDYSLVPSSSSSVYLFSNSSNFMLNNKLAVPNPKTMQALIQYSTLFHNNYPSEWRNYQRKVSFKNPFFTSKDFQTFDSNLIFSSIQVMQKYFLAAQKHIVRNVLDINTMIPYIFEWSGKPVLIQNTGSEDKQVGLQLIHEWNRYSINSIAPKPLSSPKNYTVYPIDALRSLKPYTLLEYVDDNQKEKYLAVLHLK